MAKVIVNTDQAPAAIGTYNQAVKVGTTVYLSGQIPLVPQNMEIISQDFTEQAHQVFKNLVAVCEAAGGELQDMVKVNIFLTDLSNFAIVNDVMSQYFKTPYPARAAVQVSALPKAVQIEIDGIMEIPSTN
ncbi:reactive intermediate/imine deaminase [Pseudoalteromonas sp. NBT06-2]|uniref:RidA family protein n=1 Tax=Pseudoalteromonas sp. NBT06-2 TaxID=2025950 RepID=UPI000BA6BB04|nr:RidA family protein [Pseudoalteromonas sp. NBT06-2]PAJ75007.1 reactive intermediate/imine deaminase [Pseudoalteromonas sp. NBT06-2]